jgi:hypothetical protein
MGPCWFGVHTQTAHSTRLLLGPTETDILTVPSVDICVKHFAAKIQ